MKKACHVATCAFELKTNGKPASRIMLMPAKPFRGVSRGPRKASHWHINPQKAKAWLSALASRETPLVIDYEHQTLHTKDGVRAPAAGRFTGAGLQLDEDGLWATDVEWTATAAEHITNKEYLYISPVFTYDDSTGEVTGLFNAALTNTPEIDGMPAVLEAATQFINQQEGQSLDEILQLLGLAEGATEEDIAAAIKALQQQLNDANRQVAAASQAASNTNQQLVVDLQQQVVALSQQVTTLESANDKAKVQSLVEKAIADGKLAPSQRAWAVSMGDKDIAALTQFIDSAPSLGIYKTQTDSDPPDGDNGQALDDEQLAICGQMGISPEQYAKEIS